MLTYISCFKGPILEGLPQGNFTILCKGEIVLLNFHIPVFPPILIMATDLPLILFILLVLNVWLLECHDGD